LGGLARIFCNGGITQSRSDSIIVEKMLTRLRTKEGIDLNELESLFGENQKNYCLKQSRKYIENQMMEQANEHLRLTRKGVFVSDGVICDVMAV
jgi:oxygen-independent coproporphyrinogen-3 oxidase